MLIYWVHRVVWNLWLLSGWRGKSPGYILHLCPTLHRGWKWLPPWILLLAIPLRARHWGWSWVIAHLTVRRRLRHTTPSSCCCDNLCHFQPVLQSIIPGSFVGGHVDLSAETSGFVVLDDEIGLEFAPNFLANQAVDL